MPKAMKVILLAGAVLGAATWIFWKQLGPVWHDLDAAIRQVDAGFLALSFVFVLISYLFRAVRWGALIQHLKPQPDYWKLTRAQVAGFTAVILFGRPGEFVRPYLIAEQQRLPFNSQLSVWFLERIFDLLVVLVLFGFSLSQLGDDTAQRVGAGLAWVLRSGGATAGVMAAICCGVILAFRFFAAGTRQLAHRVLGWLPGPLALRLHGMLDAFFDGLAALRSTPQIFLILLYSFLLWASILAVFYCLCQGFPPTARLTLSDAMIVYGFVAFGGAVQIPGIGGGVQVVTVLVLTELYGLPLAPAGVMALLLWISSMMSVPLGLLVAFQDGLDWGQLKSQSAAAGAGVKQPATP